MEVNMVVTFDDNDGRETGSFWDANNILIFYLGIHYMNTLNLWKFTLVDSYDLCITLCVFTYYLNYKIFSNQKEKS